MRLIHSDLGKLFLLLAEFGHVATGGTEEETRADTGEIQSLQESYNRRAITMTAYTFFGCAFTAYGKTGLQTDM